MLKSLYHFPPKKLKEPKVQCVTVQIFVQLTVFAKKWRMRQERSHSLIIYKQPSKHKKADRKPPHGDTEHTHTHTHHSKHPPRICKQWKQVGDKGRGPVAQCTDVNFKNLEINLSDLRATSGFISKTSSEQHSDYSTTRKSEGVKRSLCKVNVLGSIWSRFEVKNWDSSAADQSQNRSNLFFHLGSLTQPQGCCIMSASSLLAEAADLTAYTDPVFQSVVLSFDG